LVFQGSDSIFNWYGNQALKSQKFYDSLKSVAYKRKITSVLYQLAFKSPSSQTQNVEPVITSREMPYVQYSGKIVHKIEIIRLLPFTPDSTKNLQGFLNRFGNSLHTLTRQSVIRKEMFFKPGDELDPLVLADNERILRALPFIDEANIQVVETSPGSDSVDLIVVTKDKFSYAFSGTIKNARKFSVRVWSVNVMGLGHRFDNKISVNTERTPVVLYEEGKYEISNIGGSFIKGLLKYTRNDDDRREITAGISRDLIPPLFDNAFGIKAGVTTYPASVNDPDGYSSEIRIGSYQTDLYYTNGIALKKNIRAKVKHPSYLLLSARSISLDYFSRPFVSADSNLGYRSRLTLIGGIGIARNNYFITNYVFSFGKTEDIPYGYTFQLIGGYELGEFYNRPYTGLLLGYGNYFTNAGYVYSIVEVGTYYKDSQFQQGLLQCNASYATPAFKIKNARIRNYLNINYTQGFHRISGEVIRMDDRNGFEGLGINDLLGQKRLVAGTESVVFTPWYIYGFSTAVYGFVNCGILTTEDKALFDNPIYVGLGVGLRIRNENLVFNTLQIQFSYFPVEPPGASATDFSLSGIPEKSISGFYSNAPSIPSFY